MLVAKGIRYLIHKSIMKIMNVTWWSGKAKIQRPNQQKGPFTAHNFEGEKFKPNIKHLIHVTVCALVKKNGPKITQFFVSNVHQDYETDFSQVVIHHQFLILSDSLHGIMYFIFYVFYSWIIVKYIAAQELTLLRSQSNALVLNHIGTWLKRSLGKNNIKVYILACVIRIDALLKQFCVKSLLPACNVGSLQTELLLWSCSD